VTTAFFGLHCTLCQEARLSKSQQMNQVKESFIKPVNFSCPSVFNQREFVALLEEEENDYGEIIYHANLRCLFKMSSFICGMRSHHSLKRKGELLETE